MTSEEKYVKRLEALPRLKRPHIQWSAKGIERGTNDLILTQLSRITGTVTLGAEWITQQRVEGARAVCEATGAKLCVKLSPYHLLWAATGPDDLDEAWPTNAWTQCEHACGLLKQAGESWGQPINYALLICEAYPLGKDATPTQIANRSERYQAIQHACQELLGEDVLCLWSGFSAVHYGYGDHWHWSPHFRRGEDFSAYVPVLYWPERNLESLEILRETHRIAGPRTMPFWPKIALGATYEAPNNHWNDPRYSHASFNKSGDYPLSASWIQGRTFGYEHAHRRYGDGYEAALRRIDGVIFYPEISMDRSRSLDHFIAYCRGAENQHENWQGLLLPQPPETTP